ncbi:transmembrane protein sting isoform X2 [Arctopsyche grandis]|uniref:transmembrane protein sting isoform X2 n=2 Tax=Arctopsyche grandis TaxID=121162 RepID=UPI00406DA1C7
MKLASKKALSRRPKNYNVWTFVVLLVITCAGSGILNGLVEILKFTTWCIVAELLLRVAQVIEYDMSLEGRHSISTRTINQIWNFNKASLFTVFIVTVLVTSLSMTNSLFDLRHLLPMICAYVFIRAVNFSDSVYMKSLWIENSNGLDYGSGMAYSFFYGYLNIILPNKGDQNYGLKELMDIFESSERIKFGTKKLFIMIPRSLYCPPNLCEVSKGPKFRMEAAKNLEAVERHRAGVKSRMYTSSVYKIHVRDQKGPMYVAAEGATPLLTLFETIKNDGVHQKYYRENQDEIILQFYLTLKHLIESSVECKDICELVYYDNIEENVNVGELLYRRVIEIQNISN